MSERSPESAHLFESDELKMLALLAERVTADSEWADRRLVVAVYDQGDQRPIAWIERHPSDSDPTVRFGAEGAGDV